MIHEPHSWILHGRYARIAGFYRGCRESKLHPGGRGFVHDAVGREPPDRPAFEGVHGLGKKLVQIKNVRKLRKTDMVRNAAMPRIEVDAQTFEVRADGALLTCPPAAVVPLCRRYLLR